MKWGLRFLGCCDILTFFIFIIPKTQFFIQTFEYQNFSMAQKASALWEVLVLLFFLSSGTLLILNKKSGLLFSFILIPFRVAFLYFSFDFISYLLYHLGYQTLVSSAPFQSYWFWFLLITEVLRYTYSLFVYYRLSKD
ncbi:MAG: hypothetical protein KKE39_01295 [Bacteroidetes bacterium]|nr:hypothetical protein [Bacteroidota bacterium]MBU1371297.1 hypothetical protein [Bacteroidota bacterium]MBU1485784.1 hypothetical protein [Bacteroidota bacterium]MBU2267579.1 hypothetical protein [Bacteroidota bacterium]MBU2376275.1 hypothetical protein [Bacteroidota bacterium]